MCVHAHVGHRAPLVCSNLCSANALTADGFRLDIYNGPAASYAWRSAAANRTGGTGLRVTINYNTNVDWEIMFKVWPLRN